LIYCPLKKVLEKYKISFLNEIPKYDEILEYDPDSETEIPDEKRIG
jgi:hypothetical protein